MDNKQLSTQKLINELQNRIILDLKDNEQPCPICKGLKFILVKRGNEAYIRNCHNCFNGKVYKCKYCGKLNKTDYCNCKEAEKEREIERQKKQEKLFKKAKKINSKKYDGYFILNDDGHINDINEIYDWLYEKIKYNKLTDKELPKYLWGTKAEPVFDLNIKEIIEDKCENGYEDMISYLEMDDNKLDKVQSLLDKWYEEQNNNINVYYEDYSVAVLLDDLIKDIREKIKKEDE